MSNVLLQKNLVAGGAIPANRFVMFGADDNTVVVATSATSAICGANDQNFDVASGERCDIAKFGIVDIKAGGTITRGAPVTSDATGQAIATSTAGNRIAGFAEASAVAGDVIPITLAFGVL